MTRLLTAIAGASGVVLPGGWNLDGGDSVIVSDAEWDLISADTDLVLVLADGGVSVLPATPPPSWRDIQQGIAHPPSPGGGGGGGASPYLGNFNIPVAVTPWVLTHNQGTKGVSVIALNGNGDEMIASRTDSLDGNTVYLNFYYAQSGSARVWAH